MDRIGDPWRNSPGWRRQGVTDVTRMGALAAFLTLLGSGAVHGDTQGGFAGLWQCQASYTELNQTGQRTSGFVRQYQMAVYENGTYEAQGTQAAADGYTQFRSQGQWRFADGVFMAQGPEQSTAMVQLPGMMFGFVGQPQPDGTMAYTYEQADPTGTYIMNRSIYACQTAR